MHVESVVLRARALTQILGYAIEVYKKECAGVLMGDAFKSAKKVVVNSAIALQTAKRGYTRVDPNWNRFKRVEEVLSFLSLDWILGEFHSHTDSGGEKPSFRLSPDDRDYIRESYYQGEVELVVVLSKKKRKSEWKYTNNDCVLKGTLGDYNIELGAHFKADEEDGGTLSEIWCPIVEVAALAYELDLSPAPGYIFDYIPPEFHAARYRKLTRLIRKYEDLVITKMDLESGEELLYGSIQPLMKEIGALSDIYG
ncbi:MAG: hypothetical protein ACFFE1_17350 [Candidatus Thorarchaeota archaeon]